MERETFILLLASSRANQACPTCAHASLRVQSRSSRWLADLPGQGRAVGLRLQVRRVFCENPAWTRQTVAEQFPEVAPASARRTLRQGKTFGAIAFALGGRAGARFAGVLGLPVSFWTVLRLLRGTLPPPFPTPRVLGVDDLAWRKGDHSGTLLVDRQTPKPLALLPDREAETFAAWRREPLGVEVVRRDRASGSAEGARKGAPDALPVADRSHVVAHRRDALPRLLDRDRQCFPPRPKGESAAVREASHGRGSMEQAMQQEEGHREAGAREPLPRAETLGRPRRGKRDERSQAVVELHRQGLGGRAIARETGLSRHTVHRSLHAGPFPEPGPRKNRRRQ